MKTLEAQMTRNEQLRNSETSSITNNVVNVPPQRDLQKGKKGKAVYSC